MKCKTAEKWISDFIDRELETKKLSRLREHLQSCQSCSVYQKRLQVLHETSLEPEKTAFNAEYAGDSIVRLKNRLTEETSKPSPKSARDSAQGWSWSWGLAGSLAVGMLFFFLVLPRTQENLEKGKLVFSLDETVAQVYAELGNDPELANRFNALLFATIQEELATRSLVPFSSPLDPLLFWEDLTEEELRFLESELKKEIKS